MLPFFRKNIKIFIWIIVLSFILWGAGTLVTSKDSSSIYAGSIHGKKVSLTEYQNTIRFYDILMRANSARSSDLPQETQDNQESQTPASDKKQDTARNAPTPKGPSSASGIPSYEELRSLAWQTLILSREAQKMNLNVSDEEVSREIYALFPNESGFNQKFYEIWIQNQFRGRARDFEETVRRNLEAEKVRQKVLEDIPDDKKQSKWMEFLINTMSKAQLKDYTAANQ